MLTLKNIRKVYSAGDQSVEALKGVSLDFRKSEFVSILGQSGCGKTTLLNIIGGLDKYTEGDLIINGKSTKEFKDRDWDSYRNHSIGFVFQTYNLIPHQTVLQNVELALTLSGVSKAERKARAKKALEEVGLGDQLKKKPNEMSGGQMQRVAIARALVNNPDIILADEPTGALDTQTSVQVMEILKKISKDRLIIMVTHNPELADEYSSRIIRMLDGKIIDDSAPLSDDEKAEMEKEQAERLEKEKAARKKRKEKKPSMSFRTSFMLSLKNLFTKKGRTALTSFAGSIGIIGIALILSVSHGMTTYINEVQESTLSSYPLTIEATTVELSSLMETFMNLESGAVDHDKDAVYKKSAIYDIVNALNSLEEIENDLTSFKKFLTDKMADPNSKLYNAVSGIQYGYDLDMLIYTESVDGDIIRSDTEELMQELILEYMNIDMSAMTAMSENGAMSSFSSMSRRSNQLWQELLTGNDGAPVNDLLYKQYDRVYGSWPNSHDEVVLVLDENNELDDLTLYALGLLPEEELSALMAAAQNGTVLEDKEYRWTYEEICKREYKTILNADCYIYDETTQTYNDLRNTDAGLKYLYDNAMTIKVSGIIRPNEDSSAHMLTGSIGYTKMLTDYVIDKAKGSAVIEAQLKNPNTDILTGLPFKSSTGNLSIEQKAKDFRDYIGSLSNAQKIELHIAINSIPTKEYLEQNTSSILAGTNRATMEAQLLEGMSQQMGVGAADIEAYLASMSDEEITELYKQSIVAMLSAKYAEQVKASLGALSPSQLLQDFNRAYPRFTDEQCAAYYDQVMQFSESSYEENLIKMGHVNLDSPATVNIFASSFENKDIITATIEEYNRSVEEVKQIKYTDYIGLMMSSITTIINAITYVLIAFVAISLVVSSIMIGVITLISVQERTKEIGILRAIGASKRNVSSMFNAETMIVGFTAGLLGVVVTYLLCIPINYILHTLTGINTLSAILPLPAAIILIAISVVLTLFSGLIPSRSAAKKDPVVALRTE